MRRRLEEILHVLDNQSYSNAQRVDLIRKAVKEALAEVPTADKGDPDTVLKDADIMLKDSPEHEREREQRQAEDALAANPPGSPHNLIEQASSPPTSDHVKDADLVSREALGGDEGVEKPMKDSLRHDIVADPGTVVVADDGLTNDLKEAAHHQNADNGEKVDNPPPASDTLVNGVKTGDAVSEEGDAVAEPARKQRLGKHSASSDRRDV
jgi:hypothetical protein